MTRNSLELWLASQSKWTDRKAMNALTDNGIVSDNAVWARDVEETDCPAAVAWLEKNQAQSDA